MDQQLKRMRVNSRHWDLLLNLLEEHPEMITGKFVCQNAKQRANQLWEEAASRLNGLGLGEKTPDKWKVAVQDWKYKTKMKVAEIKEHEKKTGGGPPIKVKLSEQEERLMNIVGWTAALGNQNVPESGPQPPQVGTYEMHPELEAGPSYRMKPYSETYFDSEAEHAAVQSEEIILETQEDRNIVVIEDQPSLHKNKRLRVEDCSKKRKVPNMDEMDRYQNETMEVLQEISQELKSISTDIKSTSEEMKSISINIKSISQSLSVIASVIANK